MKSYKYYIRVKAKEGEFLYEVYFNLKFSDKVDDLVKGDENGNS